MILTHAISLHSSAFYCGVPGAPRDEQTSSFKRFKVFDFFLFQERITMHVLRFFKPYWQLVSKCVFVLEPSGLSLYRGMYIRRTVCRRMNRDDNQMRHKISAGRRLSASRKRRRFRLILTQHARPCGGTRITYVIHTGRSVFSSVNNSVRYVPFLANNSVSKIYSTQCTVYKLRGNEPARRSRIRPYCTQSNDR